MSEKVHVLVVEDDPLVSEVIAAALEDRFRTTIVETAAAALHELQSTAVRLMLLDCTLPGGVDPALIPAADQAGVDKLRDSLRQGLANDLIVEFSGALRQQIPVKTNYDQLDKLF